MRGACPDCSGSGHVIEYVPNAAVSGGYTNTVQPAGVVLQSFTVDGKPLLPPSPLIIAGVRHCARCGGAGEIELGPTLEDP